MPSAPGNTRPGALVAVAAVVAAALTAAPARAADLPLPPDAQMILKALKAKRLVRCPRVESQPRCGGGARRYDPRRTVS